MLIDNCNQKLKSQVENMHMFRSNLSVIYGETMNIMVDFHELYYNLSNSRVILDWIESLKHIWYI